MNIQTKVYLKWSMLRHDIRRRIYRIKLALCKDIVNEEMVQCLHPDFGWYWQEDGDGHRLLEQAHQDGIQEGRVQAMKIVDDSVLVKDNLLQLVIELRNKLLIKYEGPIPEGIAAAERKALLDIDLENGK